MTRKNIMTILLVVALGICMAGCGGKAQSENEGTAQAQTESEEKKNQFAGPWVTNVNPEEGQGQEENGAGDYQVKKSGITWYVNSDATVMKYEGKLADQFLSDYYEGKSVDLVFEFAPDGTIEVRKHVEAGHLQFSYNYNGKAGMYCDGFEESYLRDYGCNNSLEICGDVEDGAVYVCVYHNGIYVGPDDFPHVMISYYDVDNQDETMLYDDCGKNSQQYSGDVPERFMGKVGECKNLYGLGDFPFANVGKAKTDDYQLDMANENYIELISYNDAGKVVDVIGFARNPETGEITESEGYARGKYLDLQNFSASASINAYPCYFSKPYLTPSQFAGMEDY